MKKAKGFLTRHADGQVFPVFGAAKRLPKLAIKKGGFHKLPQEHIVTKIVQVRPRELEFREKEPLAIEDRKKHFISLILRGIHVPPIVVFKNKRTGKWRVYDGLIEASRASLP
jgi:hypothetical protein